MKTLSLLLPCIVLLSMASCTTLANRRDLYQPTKPQGPYTDMRYAMDDPGPQHGAPNR